ncbi:MAG: hypothetical protein IPN01_15290 [Deltaproteobacteria bacterium]|nr:hypothetical protein [Deltaproteobacteria bacterium]
MGGALGREVGEQAAGGGLTLIRGVRLPASGGVGRTSSGVVRRVRQRRGGVVVSQHQSAPRPLPQL